MPLFGIRKRENAARYYRENREKILAYAQQYGHENHSKIRERRLTVSAATRARAVAFLGGKCVRCGKTDDPSKILSKLEFHHKALKTFNVGAELYRGWEFVKAEVKKCELRCRGCHIYEHYRRLNKAKTSKCNHPLSPDSGRVQAGVTA